MAYMLEHEGALLNTLDDDDGVEEEPLKTRGGDAQGSHLLQSECLQKA